MGLSLKSIWTGCWWVRWKTFRRYLTSFFWRACPSANVPLPSAWGPCIPGTNCGINLTTNTGWTVSRSWRVTPPCFKNVRGLGVKYHLGASGTDIMIQKFRLGEECWSKWMTLQQCFKASWFSISVNSEPMEPVATFSYLSCTVSYNNSDWAAFYQNR